MKLKIISRSIALVIVGLLIAPSLSSSDANASSSMRMNTMQQIKGMPMQQDMMDRHFIKMMIPHHQMAVAMADIELTRGTNADIKAMATQIKTSQTAEIEQLASWYVQWFGDEPKMQSMDMSMIQELQSRSDVDRTFVELMIPHHQQAIAMARMEVVEGGHSELLGFAQKTITEQGQEVQQMVEMLHSMR